MHTKELNNDFCVKNREKTVIKVHVESSPCLRRVLTQIRRLHEQLR